MTPKTEHYLMHHGIQGMKWGVTNGPPYPLGQEVCAMFANASSSSDYNALLKVLKSEAKNPESGYTKEQYKMDKANIKEIKKSENPEATKYSIQAQGELQRERENAKKMSDDELFEKTIAKQEEVNRLAMEKMYTDTFAQKYSLTMESKYNTSVDKRDNYGLDKGIKSKEDLKSEKATKNDEAKENAKKEAHDVAMKVGISVVSTVAGIAVKTMIDNKRNGKTVTGHYKY